MWNTARSLRMILLRYWSVANLVFTLCIDVDSLQSLSLLGQDKRQL